jgi:hypothetical protein
MYRLAALAALLPLLTTTATAQVLENRQVARQSAFFGPSHPAVRGDTISLNGGYLKASWDMTLEEFVAAPEEETAAWFRYHLKPGGHLEHITNAIARGDRPTVYIYLDIEYQLHPKNLWKYWDPTHHPTPKASKQEVAAAFAMRMRVTKEVLKEFFPDQDVRVGLFSTLEPAPGGYPTDHAYLRRLDNLVELGSLGMFDHADFLAPTLFTRFAVADPRSKWVERYALQALEGSSQIRRSDGSSLPLMPQLTIRIYNGGQPNGRIQTPWLQQMIESIRTSGHWIEAICFWVQPTERDDCILAYFDQLFSPHDWNFDCVWDTQDDLLFTNGMLQSEPMADMNRDGVINDLDWDLYQEIALRAPTTTGCGSDVICPCPTDIFDFLKFQELFAAGDPSADLNGDGVLDFFDFIQFQEEAANPCP